MAAKAIPDGYRTITPYLIVRDGARAIDFYTRAFGANERMRLAAPGGKIGHAELTFGDSVVMLADEHPEMGYRAPDPSGGAAVSIHLYVDDVDARFAAATAAGATSLRAVANQFYGDRAGTLRDPFGHVWTLSTHVEDVPPDEIARRAATMAPQ